MANVSKTPAPSRRFLHPSSTTPAPTSARKPVPPFSQVRASGASASPYGRASQFSAIGTHLIDDISTSFGEDDASPSRYARPIAAARTHDDIVIEHQRPPTSEYEDHLDDESADAAQPYQANDHWRESEWDTPMPKRRKVTESRIATSEPIQISSSPSDMTPQSPTVSEAGVDSLSPAKFTTPQTVSRFRAPASTIVPEDGRPSRPAFKAVDTRPEGLSAIASALPEAFTPSRKKGKREYVHGGLADTVRSWVLQISTEESQRGTKDERVVSLVDASTDRSRRGVTAVDTKRERWLLAGSQPWSVSSISQSVARINDGEYVTVRGTSTTWTVPLQSIGSGPDIHVAGQWDLPP